VKELPHEGGSPKNALADVAGAIVSSVRENAAATRQSSAATAAVSDEISSAIFKQLG